MEKWFNVGDTALLNCGKRIDGASFIKGQPVKVTHVYKASKFNHSWIYLVESAGQPVDYAFSQGEFLEPTLVSE